MTQVLLYQARNGIALATDSRAIAFLPQDRSNAMQVQKHFLLTPHVVLVTAGAGHGILLCRLFQAYIENKGVWEFEDIARSALPFLRSELQRLQSEPEFPHERPELDRVYFLIAGYLHGSAATPFRFELLGCENASDSLHSIKSAHILAIPRQMSLEYRLSRLAADASALDRAEELFEDFLNKLAAESEDVGPPFIFIRVTSGGVEVRTRDQITREAERS